MNAPSPSFDAVPRHDWTREELRALFALPFPELLFRAQSVHRMHFDPREVQISTLLSIKTGGCPEDCAYCPQSASYETGVKANKLMDVDAVLADAKYEADDLIGSALMALRMAGFRGVIVSADKDFGQLIGDGDEQWDPQRNQRWDTHGVKTRLGVRPDQVADYLALTGDGVDNIPGVPGIGPKTAAILLHHFDTLDALIAQMDADSARARGILAATPAFLL